jgi:LmbE family N-acetylglucosaminyl deacetylase
VSYRNTVGYFLRLPDGSPEGVGYSETGYQSLKLLSESQIRKLTAIDETASYYDWGDLTETIRSIIEFERGDAVIQLHIPDLDPVLNPNDHSDHYMTAKAALNAAEGLSAAARVHHVGYASAGLPENLGGQSRDMKCATYAVTLAGVLAMGHPVSWGHYDQLFIGRNYFRVDDSGPQ